ncbi:hypothetical protein [Caballeronia sordidicola]|uniref:Uncharacterized protein n=1 Tax=Caballeronia sordidicola TaxID=196367 RepID=A0A242MML5_CABSO|nr:hypothetical protein [Caballeronia sordidicola]OTP72232.1 hypothetical protein PAMC26510_22140 [Caballeronia sordidicola]
MRAFLKEDSGHGKSMLLRLEGPNMSKQFNRGKTEAAEPGAGHVDLYDRVNLIPWVKLTSFFSKHLTQTVTS